MNNNDRMRPHKAPKKVKVPLFRPFRHQVFRRLCVANFLANIGSWMQIFATGWLVASQTTDPSVAALAQTLTQIPVFLFSVMGGVLADRFNTYRYLGGINLGMAFSCAALAAVCLLATPTISTLFIFTFLIASGTALKASAWQATMSSLVEPDEIEAAATLNGLSYNLASVIGPTLGATFFVITGPAVLYFTNALCLTSLMAIYFLTLRTRQDTVPKKPRSLSALLTEGIRVSAASAPFRGILLTTAVLFFSVSPFQALLPAYVNLTLQADSHTLGLLMGGFGSGAVLSAFALPTLRSLLPRHHLLALAAFIYALSLLSFSALLPVPVLLVVTVIGGMAWAALISTMNSAAQSVFGPEVRARALSIYSMCFYGALTLGSLTWGKISGMLSIETAFMTAGCSMVLTALYILVGRRVADEREVQLPPVSSGTAGES